VLAIVILAAGKGTRMKSDLPKVLHRLGGKPLIAHVLDTAHALAPDRMVVIVGHRREEVIALLADSGVEWVVQDPQLGTGHAVLQTRNVLSEFQGDTVVLSGDVPLLKAATLQHLIEFHRQENASATVLSTYADDPAGYGRIIRGSDGQFVRIVEEREASPLEKAIHEINSGVYCFRANELFQALIQVKSDNSKGEYYLTDIIGILKTSGKKVQVYDKAKYREVQGINTLAELAEAEAALQAS
jgi:UDP-N-acetylglucosamine diphosphorylase/glucosamine-1-phosphate N-acetyltransferase